MFQADLKAASSYGGVSWTTNVVMWSLKQFGTTWIQVLHDLNLLGTQLERVTWLTLFLFSKGDVLGCFRRSVASRPGEVIHPTTDHSDFKSAESSAGFPSTEERWRYTEGEIQQRASTMVKGLENFPKRKVWDSWNCSVYSKGSPGQIASWFKLSEGRM